MPWTSSSRYVAPDGTGDGPSCDRRPRHPRYYGVVPLAQVCHLAADAGDDASTLVPEDHGAGLLTVVHLVDLGVADAAGEELDRRLVRLRIGDLQLVDEERLIDADLDGCPASHGFSWQVSSNRGERGGPPKAY